MILNKDTANGLFRTFNTLFNRAFMEFPTFWQEVAMRVPSGSAETRYKWMGNFPKMREWLGDRQLKDLTEHGHTIVNKKWETTVEVDADDISDDQYGVYAPLFESMGQAVAAHPDELIFQTLLPNGFSTTCYDGQYFFDTDHPMAGSTASNFTSGASAAWYLLDTRKAIRPFVFQEREAPVLTRMDRLDDENVFMRDKLRYGAKRRDNAGYGLWQLAHASTATLNSTNYEAAREAMGAYTDDEAKPLGIVPNLLVVPSSLEAEGRTILSIQNNAAGAGNIWYNTARLLVVPWL